MRPFKGMLISMAGARGSDSPARPHGRDPASSSLIPDESGNLYRTSAFGGANGAVREQTHCHICITRVANRLNVVVRFDHRFTERHR